MKENLSDTCKFFANLIVCIGNIFQRSSQMSQNLQFIFGNDVTLCFFIQCFHNTMTAEVKLNFTPFDK